MLKIKSHSLRQALAKVSAKTPASTQQELHKLVQHDPKLQKWMRVAGTSVQDLERIVRNGK